MHLSIPEDFFSRFFFMPVNQSHHNRNTVENLGYLSYKVLPIVIALMLIYFSYNTVYATVISDNQVINYFVTLSENNKDLLTYNNSAFGLRMLYPAGLVIEQSDDTVGMSLIPYDNVSNSTRSSQGDAYLFIHKINSSGFTSIEEVKNYQLRLLNLSGILPTQIELRTVNISCYTGQELKFIDSYSTHQTLIFSLQNNYLYVFEYLSSPIENEKYLPLVKDILNSVRFIGDSNDC